MRIPRQPDGSPAASSVPGPAATGAAGLRARRSQLVGRLRAVAYWQRLVQARVDLVVAALLYGTPAPPPPSWPAVEDLQSLAAPPDGLDVTLLIGTQPADGGPGGHLEQLRRSSVLLTGRRRDLEEELDAVTLALHDRLASDGEEDTARSCGTVSPLVTGPPA